MSAVLQVEVVGFDELKKAVAQLEATTASQVKLQQECVALTRSMKTLVEDGFKQLISAVKNLQTTQKAAEATTQKQITSALQLSNAWKVEGVALKELNAQLLAQKAASSASLSGLQSLTFQTNKYVVAAREALIVDRANIAAANQISAAYGKISATMAERMNLENGMAAAVNKRLAKEQALLAIAQETNAANGIAIRSLQTRIVMESALSNAQKMRVLASLGLIDLDNKHINNSNNLNNATRNLTNSQTALGSAFRGVGAASGSLFLTYGQMIPMITAFVAAAATIKSIKLGTEFDYVTKYATAVAESSGDADVSLTKLQSTILGFSGLGKGPMEIAKGYLELVKAGYSAAESLEQVGYATKFAVVSEMELKDATQSLVGLTRAFAEEGQDMAKVADIIAKAALLSSTDVKEMTDAMAHMTELSSVANVSLTDAATAMGLMANAGIRGSKAATSVRTAVLRILSPTESLQKAMDAAGVSIGAISSDGKIKGMRELFMSVQKILNVIPKKEQVSFLADMFDIRTMKGAATLLESIRSGSWDEFNSQLKEAKGYVSELHDEMKKSSKFWADELVASFERAAIAATDSDVITDSLKKLNEAVSDPGFSSGLSVLVGGFVGLGNLFLTLAAEPVAALGRLVTALKEAKEEISAFYNLSDMIGGGEGGGLFDTLTAPIYSMIGSLPGNISKEMGYAKQIVGWAREKVTSGRREDFMATLPSQGGQVPMMSATGAVPDYLSNFSRTSGFSPLRSSAAGAYSDEVLSYSMVSLNPTVNKLTDAVSKFEQEAKERKARFSDDDTRKAFEKQKVIDETAKLIGEIKASEDFGVTELGPLRRTEIEKAERARDDMLEAIDLEYSKRSQKTVEQAETQMEKLAKIQNIQHQFMPSGQAKDMAELNKKYEDGVASIEPYIKAQGRVGEEARATKQILDESLKSGSLEIQSKYAAEYADKVADAGLALDALGAKDKSLSTLASESEKIAVGFEKYRNTQSEVADTLRKDLGPGAEEAANKIDGLVESSKEAEKTMQAAFKADLLEEFNDGLEDLNEQYIRMSPHQERLKSITEAYEKQRETAEKLFKGTSEYDSELAKVNASLAEVLAKDIELAKTSDSLWAGFSAGAREAQQDMKTLGSLGYEIFQDLKEGLAGVWKSVLTGDFDSVGSGFKAIGDSLLDTVTSHFSEVLATKTLSIGSEIFGGLFSSLGLGDIFGGSSPSYTGGAMNVFVTNGDGLLGGEAGGGIIESIKSGVSEVFGPTIAGWLGKIGSAVGVAGGAYGLYSGYKAMKEGNAGSGALQMGLGAVSAYKGAVGLGMINPGTATAMMKSLATSVGFQTAASETAVTAISSQAGQRAAVMAAQKALSGTATTAATAYTPGAGATSYGTFQSAASSGGMAGGVAAGATYATVAAAAVMVIKGIIDKSNRPDAANEIDKAGVTPGSLGAIHNQWKDLNQTVLASIPGFQNYTSAIYSTRNSMLVASGAAGSMALRYDETAAAGNRWKTFLTSAPPALMAAAEATATWNISLTGNNSEVGEAARLAAVGRDNLAAMNAMLSATGSEVVQVNNALSGTASASNSAASASNSLSNAISSEAAASKSAANSTNGFASTLGSLTPPLSQVKAAASGAAPSIYSLINSIQGFGASIGSVANSVANATGALGSAASKAAAYQKSMMVSYKRSGGRIGYASGGVLQGGSYEKDDLYLGSVNGVAQVAMGGEYIMPQKQTKKYLPMLEKMRRQEYAGGGTVSGSNLKEYMKSVNKVIVEFNYSDYERTIQSVKDGYADMLKQAKSFGAKAKDIAKITTLYTMQLDEAVTAPVEEAAKALKEFKDNMLDTVAATYTSEQAQIKLQGLLAQVQGGDFSGIDKVSEFLGKISINKSDYATAVDYATAYWKTMHTVSELERLAGEKAKIPGYASGGYHAGGLRVVGENGPEIEYTGSSRIYNQDQLIDVSGLLEELKALRSAVNSGNVAVATNTMKSAESLKRMEYGGITLDVGNL